MNLYVKALLVFSFGQLLPEVDSMKDGSRYASNSSNVCWVIGESELAVGEPCDDPVQGLPHLSSKRWMDRT